MEVSVLIRKILKRLLRKVPGRTINDNVAFKDTLKITMRREDGSIYRQWKVEANTWTTAGKTAIRNAIASGGFTAIGWMYQNGGEGDDSIAATPSTPSAFIARFIATWPASPAITGITTFGLRQAEAGSNMAEETVTSFDKPSGISLEVVWETTISSTT